MAELNIPEYMITKPYGVADLYDIYDKTKANQQDFKMNEMKMMEAEQTAPIRRQVLESQAKNYNADADLNAQKVQAQKMTLGSNVAKQILAQAAKVAQEGTPEFEQAVQQFGTPMRPIVASAFGHQDDPSIPIDVNALKSLASMGAASNEYHPTVNTSTGILEFRDGAFAPMLNPQGQPYMPGAYDVSNKFDIGMADTLSKLVEQGYMDLPTAQSILKNQVMGQGQPQRQAPQVFIDQNMSPEDQELAQQDYNTYESNVAKQNQQGIPTAGQREIEKVNIANQGKAFEKLANKYQCESKAFRDLSDA